MIREIVEWLDSTTACVESWYDRDTAIEDLKTWWPDGMTNHSCGFVIYEDDNILVLSLSVNKVQVGPHIGIPKVLIRKREVI